MSILFAISILSFCALLWASLSIARHIRAGHHPAASTSEPMPHHRRAHRPPLVDLNDPPLSRRVRQNPARTPPTQTGS